MTPKPYKRNLFQNYTNHGLHYAIHAYTSVILFLYMGMHHNYDSTVSTVYQDPHKFSHFYPPEKHPHNLLAASALAVPLNSHQYSCSTGIRLSHIYL